MLNVIPTSYAEFTLKNRVIRSFIDQGYKFNKNSFSLNLTDHESKRKVHSLAKNERLMANADFIKRNIPLITKYLINGKDISITKISPKILLVKPKTDLETIFKWWNLVWWSLPYERAYGRQMRYIIWDKYHNAPIGLIGLQSPILSWSIRDKYLGISAETRDYWINQSLSAQRIGALPPYNYLLGGKLVASLMTTNNIRNNFAKKYKNSITILKKRKLPARLLFITTTGAYGKSSIYTRLKFGEDKIAKFIGYSNGYGSFHIPNILYEDLVKYLQSKNHDARRGYGSGPSRKLKLIDDALQSLGIMNGTLHGVKRAVYLFPLASNLSEVISKNRRPKWNIRSVENIVEHWKTRWALPRVIKNKTYLSFKKEEFINQTLNQIQQF